MVKRLFIISVLLVPLDSYAYLDPASGSAILYLLLALVTSAVFYSKSIIVGLYSKALSLFSKEQNLPDKFAIYSEGKQYWSTFESLVDEFILNQTPLLYLTSSKDDPVFEIQNEYIQSRYIGNEIIAASYLNNLKVDILITTTPQLNVFTFKKTKNIKHYCHIVHAPIDVHTYRKFAFDYYDSVFVSSSAQIKSIRNLETKRKMPEKDLREVGLLYYDKMVQALNPKSSEEKFTLLIAPTWKEYSLLNTCGKEILRELLKNQEWNIILRPHPQSFISFKDLMDEIVNEFSSYSNFTLDREKSGSASMQKSHMMISDLSGVVWDYIFLYEKPLLLFQTPNQLPGFEDTEIDHPSWEKELIRKNIAQFTEDDIKNLVKLINKTKSSWSSKEFIKIKEESLFNFGKSSEIAFKELNNIHQGLQS